MPKQKLPPPCSAEEFTIRRHAVGLDNHAMVALLGCSISSVTKWSAGFMPVSRAAIALVREVEVAVENEVERLVQEHDGQDEIALETSHSDWKYGDPAYAIAVSRARTLLDTGDDVKVRIKPLP